MNIILVIGLIIIFITSFVVLYFLVEKLRLTTWFQNKNFSTLVFAIITGLAFGLLTTLFQFILFEMKYTHFNNPFLYFVTAIILVQKRDANTSLLSLVIPLMTSFFLYDVDNFLYFFNCILFFLLIVLVILKEIHLAKKKVLLIISSIMFMLFLSLILASILSKEFITNEKVFRIIFTPILILILIIIYSIIEWLERFFVSANLLHESINYDHSTFFRESLYENEIKKYIKMDKISSALYGLLKFETNKSIDESIKQKVIKEALSIFKKNFNKESILFKSNKNMYGFFLPLKINNINVSIQGNNLQNRASTDELKFLEKIIKSLSAKYIIDNKEIYLKIKSSVVVYGIQEMIINRLQSLALFGFESMQRSNGNRVELFNPLIFRRRSQDSKELKKLHAALNISLLTSEFFPIFNTKNQETILINSYQTSTNQLDLDYKSISSYVKSMGVDNVLNRFLAAQVIKSFGNSLKRPVGIRYSISDITSKNFSIREFLMRLNQNETKPSNVALLFEESEILDFLNKNIIQKIFSQIKKNSLKIGVFNAGGDIEKFNQLMDLNLELDYIIISPKLYHSNLFKNTYVNSLGKLDKIKSRFKGNIIADQIRNEVELSSILESGINNIGGTLFNNHQLQPQLFDKKSKTYIEEITKE